MLLLFWGVDNWSDWCEIAAIHLSPPQQLHQLFATRVTSLIANSCNLRLTRRLRCCCNVSLLFLGLFVACLTSAAAAADSVIEFTSMFSPNRRKKYISTDFQLFSSFLFFSFLFSQLQLVVAPSSSLGQNMHEDSTKLVSLWWGKCEGKKRNISTEELGKRRKKKYVKEKRIHKVKTREWWRKKGEDEPKPLYCTTNKTKHKKTYIRRE